MANDDADTDGADNAQDLFPGFQSHWINTGAGRIFARSAGQGAPLVLLHGFPQTHVMWHAVAPELAKHFAVVVMDLRGYGWSSAPPGEGGAQYTKRVMADDVITVMEELGHVQFMLAGHDRGARVGYRLALDHPGRISKLALLDIIPTCEVWRNIEAGRAPAAHWSFLSQEAPAPEREISKDPNAYFSGLMTKWSGAQSLVAFHPAALEAYQQAWGDPTRIHAFCEDYRAGAKADRAADDADLAARKIIACPVHVLPGNFFLTSGAKPALEVWRETFAPHATGEVIPSGHFVAEENAAATLKAMVSFFSSSS